MSTPERCRCVRRSVPSAILIERVADYAEILTARFGDDEPLALAIKKLQPEFGFERLHLLAHRSRRHEQLFGGAR